MGISIKGKDFLKLLDFSSEEIRYLLDLSKSFKSMKRCGTPHHYLQGKNIVLLFEKTSTRTRSSFEVAGYDLGMGVTYLDQGSSQMGKKESIADTARVLARIYDGIEYRGYSQELVQGLADYSCVPVWNGLTDEFHPTQIIADLLTIEEKFGYLKGLNFTFMGDARNNMGNSLMVGCAKMGINFTACAPEELFPDSELVKQAKEIAKENGCTIILTNNVNVGTKNANIVYTDIWVSMGEPESVWEERIKLLKPYQVTMDIMNACAENAIFMHCLPSFHDTNTVIGKEISQKYGLDETEVTNEVFESQKSVVFDEAENRMHTIKSIIYATLG